MEKLSFYLEKALVFISGVFIVLVPYSKHYAKRYFCIAAALYLLINIFRYKRKFYQKLIISNPLNKPVLIFLGAAILSVIFSRNPYYSQSVFFERYLPYAVFFWIGASMVVKTNEDNIQSISSANLYFLAGTFLLSGIIFGIGGAYDYFRFHPRRIWTVFGREIFFKMFPLYLVYYIPFSFTVFIFHKKWIKWLGLISLIPLVFCWALQGSRDAWVAVALSILFISIFKNKAFFVKVLIGEILLIILFSLHNPWIPERIKTMVHLSKWANREPLFDSAILMFKKRPIFGMGAGMYEKLFYRHISSSSRSSERGILHAHNTYLEIAAEMGVIGLMAFIWIFVVFLKNVLKLIGSIISDNHIVLLGLAGIILSALIFSVAGSIIIVGTQAAPLFWLLFGMASGLEKTEDRNQRFTPIRVKELQVI